jgi:hypothetical protein
MDWKQIETKWAEMAHRVRADARCAERPAQEELQDRAGPTAKAKTVVAEQISVVITEIRQTQSTH